VVGDADAEAYRRFAGWAAAGAALLGRTENGPPPSLRELAAPADPGAGAGTLLAGGHGRPAARPAGGSRACVDALVRCLEAAGGRLRCGTPATRVEVAGAGRWPCTPAAA
jgi:beta-carotene ketolase (CrtO type)